MLRVLILTMILLISSVSCRAQVTQWAVSAGGSSSDKGINIGVDSLGFIYIGGYFNGTANFGSFSVTSSHSSDKDFFVAKMNPEGDFLWVTSGGGGIDDRMLGMHVDPSGNIYCTGTFWGTSGANFGSIFVSGGGYDQSFLAKMDANGNWLWAREFGAPSSGTYSLPAPIFTVWIGDDHGFDLETDDDGNIYITGWWSGVDVYFDSFTLSNPAWVPDTLTMGYVAKLDPTGSFIWVQKFDGVQDKRGERDNRLALDTAGNIYVTGGFKNKGVYGSDTLVSRGDWDIFVTKLDNSGDFQWARRAGSNKGDRGNGIAVAPDGDVYIDGEFRNEADFGSDTLNHKSRKDIFVAKLRPNGDWVWARRAKRSAGKDRANQMTVDKDEYVFVCGEIGDTIKFGDQIIENAYDDQNPFVAQLNKSGDWLWAKVGVGNGDDDRANNVVIDHLGNTYVVGFFEETIDFEGHILTSEGRKDIFVWKIDKFIDPEPPEEVIVIPESDNNISVPMAFSPNNDGYNDFLLVYGPDITNVVFDVYDRWGALVFTTTDKTIGWNGEYNGKQANSGVYVYKVKASFYDGRVKTIVGDVTLVR